MKLQSDEGKLDDIAYRMGEELLFWRVPVRQTKEKYGTVRIYCGFGVDSLHGLIYPGYAYNQFPVWLQKLDFEVISPFIRKSGLDRLTSKLHMRIYRRVYKKYITKYPRYRNNILAGADYPELLPPVQYDRMNPTLPELVARLKEYSNKDYGTEAYPLSSAEAKLLVKNKEGL